MPSRTTVTSTPAGQVRPLARAQLLPGNTQGAQMYTKSIRHPSPALTIAPMQLCPPGMPNSSCS
eukprot:12333016-Alexandrium_andersonii.AAC.1